MENDVKMRRPVLATAAFLLLAGALLAWHGGYIYLKAAVAQRLIASAWSYGHAVEAGARPWPWADTAPVARLSVPSRSVQRYVLAGAHGQALAFGPGHLAGSAPIGGSGNVVIAGHRDTHFRFLREIMPGDLIILESLDGTITRYSVQRTYVTDEMDMRPIASTARNRLTLITCYPFDAVEPGGPLRFIVTATEELEPASERLVDSGGRAPLRYAAGGYRDIGGAATIGEFGVPLQ